MNIDVDAPREDQIRWVLMLALNRARPYPARAALLQETVRGAVYSNATALEIRSEIVYLKSRGLVEMTDMAMGGYEVSLTRHGVDIVNYTVPCEPGIARPPKYW